jgi:tRNA dimethylallyltransferase
MKPVICVVGPTASGKSSLAQAIAADIGGEVVSADSMQIYRGMDIGTGKVPLAEREVAHHGLDLVDPGEPFSAALFQEYARACFEDIDGRGKRSVLCGGTGFYVRAAIDDYEFPKGEQVDNPIRERYLAVAEQEGAHALWLMLEEVDPESAGIIPENDVKRVVRAFELLDEGGSYAEQKRKLATIPQLLPACFIGLSVDPDVLRARIDERVDEMVRSGLVEEVESLLAAGFREGVTAPQAIGYKEIVKALDGEVTLAEAVDEIKVATHRYAKRQRTWFRKDKRIRWIDADSGRPEELLAVALSIIEDHGAERPSPRGNMR